MGVNKVIYGDETIIDISDSTVTPDTLADGVTAYDASGERITGTNEGAVSHTHNIADVNGLQNALDSKISTDGGTMKPNTNITFSRPDGRELRIGNGKASIGWVHSSSSAIGLQWFSRDDTATVVTQIGDYWNNNDGGHRFIFIGPNYQNRNLTVYDDGTVKAKAAFDAPILYQNGTDLRAIYAPIDGIGVTISSSDSANKYKYRKFATAKVTQAWQRFGGIFLVYDDESGYMSGIVRIRARTAATYDVGTPSIEWLCLSENSSGRYHDCVVATKDADGEYSYYIKSKQSHNTFNIRVMQKDKTVTLADGGAWVETPENITATSSLLNRCGKAMADSQGQQIDSTYIKGLTAQDGVIIYTKGDGTTGTVDIGSSDESENTMDYLGDFIGYAYTPSVISNIFEQWIANWSFEPDVVNKSNYVGWFYAPSDWIELWNEWVDGDGDAEMSNKSADIFVISAKGSATEHRVHFEITTHTSDIVWHLYKYVGDWHKIRRVAFNDEITYQRYFSGFGSIGMYNAYNTNDTNVLMHSSYASDMRLEASAQYARTGPKSGLLSIAIYVPQMTADNSGVTKFISLNKIGDILGLSFRSTQGAKITGVWQNTGGTNSDVHGYGPVCRIVDNVIGNSSGTNYGTAIEIGRYYNTGGDYGGWPVTKFNGYRLTLSNIYVEEV